MVKLSVFRMLHVQEPHTSVPCIQQPHSSPSPCSSSPTFSFSPVINQKLEGNPECDGSEGTQKWGRIAAAHPSPRAWVTAPSTGKRGNLPFEGAMAAHQNACKNMTTGAKQQVSPFLLLGDVCLSVGYIFKKIFIMTQHGKFSLVNLIKLETNEYVML